MKQLIRTIGVPLLLCILGQSLHAQSWSVVGNPGFSDGITNTVAIAIDGNGTPYVVYFDAPNGGRATVKKFNGTSWVNVGAPAFSDGQVDKTSIAIDPAGTPYVAYFDAQNGGRATVKRFNGSSWVNVGTPGFSAGQVDNTSIAINNSGVPYVVYFDATNGGRATVQRFTAGSWQVVGTPGFSDGIVNTTDIAIDPSGVPYVVYFDAPNGGRATVKKFANNNWQTVGAEGFSDGIVDFTTIAIDGNGTPYVAYFDAPHGGKMTVKKFSGSSWVTVGTEGFTETHVSYIDLAINKSNLPYVSYVDGAYGAKASVMKFNGSSWVYAGSPGFTPGIAGNTSLAFSNTGKLYIAYFDAANGGRASVQQYINPVNPADSLALVALYNSAGGNNWINKTGWLTGPARTWHGVTINEEGYVTDINLFSNNLNGTLPAALGNLSQLRTLDLYRNQLSGSIPAQLGNLPLLGVLSLGENRLSGSIPTSLGNLSNLLLLDLRVNQLTGSIPNELRQLSNLSHLFLAGNQLTGSIPAFGNMPNLKSLALAVNQLSGSIPTSLGSLPALEELALENNLLTGNIPSELGNLSNLTRLYLSDNNLSGPLPSTLGNCTKLKYLAFNNNTGLTGTIPTSLGNLTELKLLWISNAAIEGTIPLSFGNLVNLEQLIISNTLVTGLIPPGLGNLAKLWQLSLNNNQLIGSIPPSLGNLVNLTDLHLNNNQLTGPIPASLTDLNNIRNFGAGINISYNKFTFDGMEELALKFPLAIYSPQAPLITYSAGCGLAVASGGTLANSTFTWIRQAPAFSVEGQIVGNPFYNPVKSGRYFVQVTNSIANRLTLISEPTDVRITFPAQSQQYTANREETDTLGWTHYFYDYTDPVTGQRDYKLLLSLKKNGNNIGTIPDGNLEVKVAATAGAGSGQGLLLTSPLITNQSGYYVMHRYWSVIPASQPTTPVGVRFYYNDQDFADVKGSVPSLSDHRNLFFYKTEGGNPDPSANIADATKLYSIANGVNPQLDTFVYMSQGCGQHMAEYMVKSFSGGGGGGTVNGQAILPVKLSSFTGRLMNGAATLYWQTVQEQGASHFNLQRSINGLDFITIGKVMATGNSTTPKDYVFTDRVITNLGADKVHYRLQMEDLNGKQELSSIITLHPEAGSSIQLLANPVHNQVLLMVQAKEKNTYVLTIADGSGRPLITTQRIAERGMNTLAIPVQTLATGVYLLSIKSAGQFHTLRFIKR